MAYGSNRGGYNRGGEKKEYPNSGGLWQKDKRGPTSPDQGGNISIDDEVLDYVMDCVNSNTPVKLEISAWRRQGRDGDFLSLTVNIPWKVRQEQQGGGYRGGGRPSNRFRDDGPRGNSGRFEDRNERGDYNATSQAPRRDNYEDRTQRPEPRRNPYAEQRDRGSSPRPDYSQGRLDQDEVPEFGTRNKPPF